MGWKNIEKSEGEGREGMGKREENTEVRKLMNEGSWEVRIRIHKGRWEERGKIHYEKWKVGGNAF